MPLQLVVERFNKRVSIWSGRKKRKVQVEVDYQTIKSGDFTLIHLARMRDSVGNDTSKRAREFRFAE